MKIQTIIIHEIKNKAEIKADDIICIYLESIQVNYRKNNKE